MRILILDRDVFGKAGGGQAVYTKLISHFSDAEFYYFETSRRSFSDRPDNVFTIPYTPLYRLHHERVPKNLAEFYGAYIEACQFAVSARNHIGRLDFDFIDVPDYETGAGMFIKSAMSQHGFGVGKIVLALHGTNSNTLRADWTIGADNNRLRHILIGMEEILYRIADNRYAISASYAEEWRKNTGISAQVLDPTLVVGEFSASSLCSQPPAADNAEPIDVVFIGRREKIKGPDIFVDLVWAAGGDRVGEIKIIGSEVTSVTGTSSYTTLANMAGLRDLKIEVIDGLPFAELQGIFRERSIVIVPSRVDTLNLVALEALRLGCPVLVSRQAGVSHWIETNYPALSDLVIDLSCARLGAQRVRDVLENYDLWRSKIAKAISETPISFNKSSLADIYRESCECDRATKSRYEKLAYWFALHCAPVTDFNILNSVTRTNPLRAKQLEVEREPETAISSRAAGRFDVVERYSEIFKNTLGIYPANWEEWKYLVQTYSAAIGEHRFGRMSLFDQLIDLETVRERHLIAAVYKMRKARCIGDATYDELKGLVRVFEEEGYDKEACAMLAMYSDRSSSDARVRELINNQYVSLQCVKFDEFEFIDDRRGPKQRRVAVISSLYNAASKIETLLNNISIQSLCLEDEVEIVLVDSASPGGDYGAFQRFAELKSLPVVYARSRKRETIQAAWNRGIEISRAPYLCFYGADEGMHPDCLGILAQSLDRSPHVDWVMSDSIMTEVDQDGVFSHDVLRFRRSGLTPWMVYLDTTYLSWVGGLYRRSIHDRFGYYDPTFRAAGDTEFKSRILNKICIMHVPLPLGVFNNYPEERVTAHPRAEIEDQRAWYLHRTPAGMANLFANRDIAEVECLFRSCLGYKKTFSAHISTDFDLATSVLMYMHERGENHQFVAAGKSLLPRINSIIHDIECLNLRSPPSANIGRLESYFAEMRELELEAERIFTLGSRPTFGILNDNRFEQHWWSWSST